MTFCLRHPFHPNATTTRLAKEDFDSVSFEIDVKAEGTVLNNNSVSSVIKHNISFLYSFYAGRCQIVEFLEPMPIGKYVRLRVNSDLHLDIYLFEKGLKTFIFSKRSHKFSTFSIQPYFRQ